MVFQRVDLVRNTWYFLRSAERNYEAYFQYADDTNFKGIDRDLDDGGKWEVTDDIIILSSDHIEQKDIPQEIKLEAL